MTDRIVQVVMTENAWDGPTLLADGTTQTITASLAGSLVQDGKARYVDASDQTSNPGAEGEVERHAAEHAAMGVGIDVRAYGAKCDGIQLKDVAVTQVASGNTPISSATANFTQDDVGKVCSMIPSTATGANMKWGTIVSVTDSTHATCSFTFTATSITGADFVYGTDDKTAIDSAVSSGNSIFIPEGITCTTGQHTIPDGATLYGVGNAQSLHYARNFRYKGSSLVLCKYYADYFIKLGNAGASSAEQSAQTESINIDARLHSPICVSQSDKAALCHKTTIARGTTTTLSIGSSGVADLCTVFTQQQGQCVQLAGDSRITNSYIYGAGNTYSCVKMNGTDCLCSGNHMWKDADTVSTGALILMNLWEANSCCQNAVNNMLDTAFDAMIHVRVPLTIVARSVNVVGNQGFQNDLVSDNSNPCIKIEIVSGGTLRDLNIHGNSFTGSWSDPTKTKYTAIINGAAIAGTLNASNVGGNTATNCGALYTSFTPTVDGGNLSIQSNGTVTKSTVG